MHWLGACLQGNAYCAKRQCGRAVAHLAAAPATAAGWLAVAGLSGADADNLGIKIWLAASVAPGSLTLTSGAKQLMCGMRRFFSLFRARLALPMGGLCANRLSI